MHINCYPLFYKFNVVKYYLSSKAISVKNVLNIFNISNGTLFNWVKLYKKNELKEKEKYNNRSKITSEIKCHIKKYVINRVNFNYKLLLKSIKKIYMVVISKSSLYNILCKLNITRKKINKKKIYGDHKKLNKKISLLKNKVKKINKDNIISIDEVSFDTSISSEYGWGIKGKKIYKKINACRKVYTGICAVTNKKIIELTLIKKSANAHIFLNFLKKINETVDLKNKYLLLDNARIHHAKIVKQYINDNKMNVIYNTAYHPEFNPIENMFSKVKTLLNYFNNNEKKLVPNIRKSFNKIKKRDLKNYFNKALNTLFNFKKYTKGF